MNGSMAPLVELMRSMLADLHPDRLLPAQIEVDEDALRVGDVRVPLDGCAGITVVGLGKAAVAALIPPVLRWINPKDEAFGRGSE